MRLKRIISSEKGSVTIEFIGILPLFFLIMLICWQFLIGVYGVIVAQSAANEAAKVYAITQNEGDALAAAEHVLHSAGGGVGYNSGESYVKGPDSDGYFTVTVGANLDIVFLPDFIRDNMDESDRVITFERNITSRVVR
ncbi:TadE/TadG family type IV pilus assembly protein [Brevibacillus thermoruber]|uniref:TadE/TadG family type IV pilus assembly protein n=1 Tax=Brevibacillus thermoruber TaxID=33942 RepID=UPI000552159F|nr:TadE family protein [Brevibacillus thermoruber]